MPNRSFPRLITLILFAFGAFSSLCAAPFGIRSLATNGVISWTNATVPGVCTVESTYNLDGQWTPVRNCFATNVAGSILVELPSDRACYRARTVDVSGTPEGFTNLVNSYGLLETIVGTG